MHRARLLLLVLWLIFITSFFQLIPVYAVSTNLTQGLVGTTVTISELTPTQSYTILWDGTTFSSGIVPTGGIVTYIVPEANGGSHTVQVQSPPGTQVYSSSFIILPSISISPDTGPVGTSITVNGKGFAASETSVQVIYDSSSIATGITVGSNGSWSTSFAAPASYKGIHIVDASGATTAATNVADKNFTIKPGITVNPLSSGVGSALVITGSGFGNAESGINITFDGTNIRTGIVADSTGAWNATFNVPSTYSGSHVIDVSGSVTSASDIADVSFSVVSGISIDKTSTFVGDIITVTGTAFGSNESSIYITFDGMNQGTSISADTSGQWKTSISIPSTVNGTHSISAHGTITTGNIGAKSITVGAKILVSPAGGNVGDTITVNGTGFSGGTNINVKFGTVSVLTNIITDSSGSFFGTFKAPKGAGGDLVVVAIDANNISAQFIFAMDKTSPPIPQIKSPVKGATVGFIGDTKVDFKWSEVTDPSGVSYDMQVATDVEFKGIVFEYSNQTVAGYRTTDTEALPIGQYYWRVRAVDGANNASNWTVTTQFKAGRFSLTGIIIFMGVIVVVLLIIMRIRTVFFRH